MEFLLYLGTQQVVTISSPKLSKIYRLEKGKPTPVASEADKLFLLMWEENPNKNSGCIPCRKSVSKPIMKDVTYCMYQKLDLYKFRSDWEKTYAEQQ